MTHEQRVAKAVSELKRWSTPNLLKVSTDVLRFGIVDGEAARVILSERNVEVPDVPKW